jgi:hypothetical protein
MTHIKALSWYFHDVSLYRLRCFGPLETRAGLMYFSIQVQHSFCILGAQMQTDLIRHSALRAALCEPSLLSDTSVKSNKPIWSRYCSPLPRPFPPETHIKFGAGDFPYTLKISLGTSHMPWRFHFVFQTTRAYSACKNTYKINAFFATRQESLLNYGVRHAVINGSLMASLLLCLSTAYSHLYHLYPFVGFQEI